MNTPKIEYGFRGEDIEYTLNGRSIWLGFTWGKGARIHTDSIKKWNGTKENISTEDKVRILKDVIAFVKRGGEKPVVEINSDDPDKALWEGVCNSEQQSESSH